jgi:hypothetical protein
MHEPVRKLHSSAEAVAVEIERGVDAEGPGLIGVFRGSNHEGVDGLQRETRRHLAGIVSPHAVGDRVEPGLGIDEHAVFVARPHATGMRGAVADHHDRASIHIYGTILNQLVDRAARFAAVRHPMRAPPTPSSGPAVCRASSEKL